MAGSANFAVRNKEKPVEAEVEKAAAEDTPTQLPVPQGYKLLIGLPEIEETTEGGIAKSAETVRIERISSVIGFVIDIGKDAYQDKKRFPNGAYCKKGDFILMRAYSGTRFAIYGKEMRLINDDSVEAVVDDPRGIMKV